MKAMNMAMIVSLKQRVDRSTTTDSLQPAPEQVQRGGTRHAAIDEYGWTTARSIHLNCSGTWRNRSGQKTCLIAFTAPPIDQVAPQVYEAPFSAGHVMM